VNKILQSIEFPNLSAIKDDPSSIEDIFTTTKQAFASGKTKSLEWREQQIQSLIGGFLSMQPQIAEAYNKDHGLSGWNVGYLSTGLCMQEMGNTAQNFKEWAKKREYDTPLMLGPATSYVTPEPHGVVLVMGAWNYPFFVTLPYVVSAIAAGNCVVVKPSELAPNCSKCLVDASI
jgi:aldehyde dehydrogenase (NAD+)